MTWKADFSDTKNTIHSVASLVRRHPYLPANNVRYNRNFVELLIGAEELSRQLPQVTHTLSVNPGTRAGLRYVEIGNAKIDQVKFTAFLDELSLALRALAPVLAQFSDIQSDMLALKQQAVTKQDDSLFQKTAMALIKLSPLIYRDDGAAIGVDAASLPGQIRGTDAGEYDNLYRDGFVQHLAPKFIELANHKGLGQVHRFTRYVLNQFIAKIVTPAVALYGDDSQTAAVRTVTLEEIPPVFSPLRGALAGDCSMVSVPYFGMHRHARTFWIRKSDQYTAKPDGYVIMVLVEHKGERIPYVITINGVTLKTQDCLAVFQLIAKTYQRDSILVADLVQNEFLVNTRAVADAYLHIPGERFEARLPEGWDDISRCAPALQYENYYSAGRLMYVKHIELHPGMQHIKQWLEYPDCLGYEYTQAPQTMPAVSRAMIAYYYRGRCEQDKEELYGLLLVDESDCEAVRELMYVYQHGNLNVHTFELLHGQFGFGLEELMELPLYIRAPILRPIFESMRDRFDEALWVKIVMQTDRELTRTLEDCGGRADEEVVDWKISMPDVYIANYWDQIKDYLMADYGGPDHYICQRVVKSFLSVGTVEAFLDFMLKYVDVLKSLETEYNRWSDFFIRARDLLEDGDKLKNALQLTYVEHVLDKDKYHTPYHLAKTLHEYFRIIRGQDTGLIASAEEYFSSSKQVEEMHRYLLRFQEESGPY